MKTSNPIVHLCFLSLCVLLCTACPCDDPALVEIPDSDASGPILTWYVTEQTSSGAGLASSMNMYTDPVNNINVPRNATITVQLVSEDQQSGVKRIATSGGFEFTCSGTPIGISSHGFLAEVSLDMSSLTVCGLRRLKLNEQFMDVGMPCPSAEYSFANLQFNINGEAINNVDIQSISVLRLNVLE